MNDLTSVIHMVPKQKNVRYCLRIALTSGEELRFEADDYAFIEEGPLFTAYDFTINPKPEETFKDAPVYPIPVYCVPVAGIKYIGILVKPEEQDGKN